MCRCGILAGTWLLTCPSVVWADGGRATPETWWRAWNFDPLVIVGLGLLAWIYGRGFARLRMQSRRKVTRWQAASYFGGLLVVAAALLSPVDALSEELSSLHMVQHMMLMAIAAPLVAAGSPAVVLAWGVPEMWRTRLAGAARFGFRLLNGPLLWQPLFLWIVFAAVLWAWHHPAMYQTALRDPLFHDAQHLSFFVAAFFFWRAGLDSLSVRRLTPLAAIVYFFATSLHASALGVFLALSPGVWYVDYTTRTAAWGLTPLEDQQMAGFIMWMPACLAFPVAAAMLFGSWLAKQNATTPERSRPRRAAAAGG